MQITGLVTGTAGLVDVKIEEVSHGIVPGDADAEDILIVKHINETLTDLLAENEPHQSLFSSSIDLVQAMEAKDQRWPLLFVQWEVSVLEALGYMRRFGRCRPDYRHGESIYFSRTTGKVVSRQEAGAFIDRFEPVPSLIMGAKNGTAEDVHRTFNLLKMLFTDLVDGDGLECRFFETREAVGQRIAAVNYIPPPQQAPKGHFISAEERKQRQLSLRPLTI